MYTVAIETKAAINCTHSSYGDEFPPGHTLHTSVVIVVHAFDGFSYTKCYSYPQLASLVEVFDVQSELWEQRSTSGTPPKGLYNCAHTKIGKYTYYQECTPDTTNW